jgi:hypothetical protein
MTAATADMSMAEIVRAIHRDGITIDSSFAVPTRVS